MRELYKWSSLALAVFAIQFGGPVRAETCKKCKFVECLQQMIAQKEGAAAAHEAAAIRVKSFYTKDGKPLTTWDLRLQANASERNSQASDLAKRIRLMQQFADEGLAKLPSPSACGEAFAAGQGGSAETDQVTCVIDGAKLQSFQSMLPCDELKEEAAKHEQLHSAECEKRKSSGSTYVTPFTMNDGTNRLPNIRLTPYGTALEEAVAYKAEAAALKKLLEEAKKKCGYKFSGVETSCTMKYIGQRESTSYSGSVCGNPAEDPWNVTRKSSLGGDEVVETPCPEASSIAAREQMKAIRDTPPSGMSGGWSCQIDMSKDEAEIMIYGEESAFCTDLNYWERRVPATKTFDCEDKKEQGNQQSTPDRSRKPPEPPRSIPVEPPR